MNRLKIIRKNLSGTSKVLLVVFFLMALSLLVFAVSPFLLIWTNWGLAAKVGLTGLCSFATLFFLWWILYNTYSATKEVIDDEQKEN